MGDGTVANEVRRNEECFWAQTLARIAGIAERTPKRLDSYEAAQTSDRLPFHATTTGFPRSFGSSRCSTEA
jgi:hypothetical protein